MDAGRWPFSFSHLQNPAAWVRGENRSKIQAAALPCILGQAGAKHHLLGQAQNCSGKTATFALGLLSAIDFSNASPQTLVLNPTRELAVQNDQVINTLGKYTGVKTLQVLAQEQVQRKPQVHVLVGTPRKVWIWRKRGYWTCLRSRSLC